MKNTFGSLWLFKRTSVLSIVFMLSCSAAIPAQAQLLTGFKSTSSESVLSAADDGVSEYEARKAEQPEESAVEIFYENIGAEPGPESSEFYTAENQITTVSPVPSTNVETSPQPLTVSAAGGQSDEAPVDLQADNLVHNEQTQTITASGNVILEQAGRILRADQVSYNLNTDEVTATGDVVLYETNGDVHYADDVKLNEKLKNGFVDGLHTLLNDGSRFMAAQGERKDGKTTTMKDATYTACALCKNDPDADPVWQIKADEVVHDAEENRISYRNARFEVAGVPVAYTPYFSHPDGSIKQKSGFLTPSFGFRTELGAFLETEYYIAIDDTQDATVGVVAFSDEAPLGLAEYRKRWDNARLEAQGSLTSSERQDSEAGVEVTQDDEPRGHLFAEGLWDINDKWRAGLDVEWASDDQFLRQYDISNEDVLRNEVYVERFSGRHYAQANLQTFQDLRVAETQIDQPEVLPEIQASFIGEPGSMPVLGGRWSADASFLGLRRSGADQDMNRLSGKLGWQKRLVSDYGLLTTVDGTMRGDLFSVRDRVIADVDPTRDSSTSAGRFFPQLNVKSSYPVVKSFENSQVTVEPIVALTLAPNIDDRDDDIPNEDSQDVQLDTTNLFEPNRFVGKDLVEDRSRVTYGLRTGLYDHDGNKLDAFLGQSIRFDGEDNPFPAGSGLDGQESDVVGQVTFDYTNPNDSRNSYELDYRFQIDGRSLNAERHEVDAYAAWNRFYLDSRYLFATALEGTDIAESREQLDTNASLYLNQNWLTRVGAVQDFGENDGLRKAYVGLDYYGDCLFLSFTGVRNLTDDISGDSSTDILFRVGLKNLGDFPRSTFRVDPAEN